MANSITDSCLSPKLLIRDSILIFIVCVGLFLPLILSNNWFDSHDGIRYLCLFEQFRDAFKEGIFYPRYLPDNYGGYGYPDFVFYQPAFFYAVLPISFLLGDVLSSFFVAMVLFLFLGALGTYLLLNRLYGGGGAFAGAILFALTPYIFVNIYVRGDLAEFASMMILPWLLYFLLRAEMALRKGRRVLVDFLFLGMLAATLVYTHPFTAMLFYPLFLIFALCFSFDLGLRHSVGVFIFAILVLFLGASLSAPYWLTANMMKGYVNYQNALSGQLEAHLHLLFPSQLFSARWGFGGSEAGFSSDGMSFQLGFPHFLLACIGLFFSRRNITRLFFIIYLSLIILTLYFSSFIWKNVSILKLLQFPWRLLSVIAIVQILCLAPCLLRISQLKARLKYSIFVVIACIVFFVYHPMFFMNSSKAPVREVLSQHVEGRKLIMASYSSFNEFFPSYISKSPEIPRGRRNMLQIPENSTAKIMELAESSSYRYSATISNPAKMNLRVLQFYFPGFCVRLNYKNISGSIKIFDDGTFSVPIPAAENQLIEIYYAGTPFDFIAGIVAILGLATIFSVIFYQWIKKDEVPPLYFPNILGKIQSHRV